MSHENVDETSQSRQAILELLPKGTPLHRYVQWACGAHGSPPIYHLGCATTLLLYELSWRGFRLPKVVDAGEYPLAAQFLLLGHSSTGKTTAFNSLQDFAEAVWNQTATRPELDPWIELEGSMEGITSAVQERYSEETDTTPAILYDPEISKVFSRREPLSDLLCKLADSRSIQTNYRRLQRNKRDPNASKIVNPRISALYCTTEAQLAPHFNDSHRMGGVFPRLIWLRPDFSKRDIWLSQDHTGARPLAATRKDAIHLWSGWICDLQMASHTQGFKFEFTAEAHAVLHNELFLPTIDAFDPDHDDNMHAVRVRLLEKARVFAAMHAALRLDMRVLPEDVEFASKMVKLFLGMLHESSPVRMLGVSEAVRIAMRVEAVIKAAGDHGRLKRELYQKLRIGKDELDLAIDQLLDQEVIFVDNSMIERAGRYVHVESDLGRKIHAVAAAQLAEEAELQKTLGKQTTVWSRRKRSFGGAS